MPVAGAPVSVVSRDVCDTCTCCACTCGVTRLTEPPPPRAHPSRSSMTTTSKRQLYSRNTCNTVTHVEREAPRAARPHTHTRRKTTAAKDARAAQQHVRTPGARTYTHTLSHTATDPQDNYYSILPCAYSTCDEKLVVPETVAPAPSRPRCPPSLAVSVSPGAWVKALSATKSPLIRSYCP